MSNSTTLPTDGSFNPITATPDTLMVIVANYTCMGLTTVVILARIALCAKWRRKLGLDDLLLFLALAACITESVLTEHAVRRGLGTYIRPGNSSKLQRLSEITYASDLFFLTSLFLAKLSVVRMVYRFASRAAIARGKLMYLQIAVVCWGAFSIPAIAFQCGLPFPWLYLPARCTGAGALWFPVLVLSILLDLWLSASAWTALPELQIGQRARQIVTGLFALRVITSMLTVVQIALLAPALKNVNQPRALPNPTVSKSFVMNASIITAALPLLCRALAQYVAPPSTAAVIYPSEERACTTPLEELKAPTITVTKHTSMLPHPAKVDSLFKEMEIKSPSGDSEDKEFSFNFASEFDKETGAGSKV